MRRLDLFFSEGKRSYSVLLKVKHLPFPNQGDK